MSVIQKLKQQLLFTTRGLGYDIQRAYNVDNEINKSRLIKNPQKKFNFVNSLVHKYPKDPRPHLELAVCLHLLCDPRMYDQFDRYAEVMQEWLIQTGLGELDMEFIWTGMVVGSLGNHFNIDLLLRANQFGLRPSKKLVMLLPKNAQLRNPALFGYFEPHLCVIRNMEVIRSLKKIESILTLPLGLSIPMADGSPVSEIAANLVERERKKLGQPSALFKLKNRHREMGMQALKQLGIPSDAWYVTLHVREPGYRGETRANTTEDWRNANPLDYLKAIEAVTNAGGWVFRMGDPSMTPLPSMPQLIDYAHHEIRSDWMDVFLGATCMFCIGTSSGYIKIPPIFGVPVILTNLSGSTIQFYNLFNSDLFMPKLLKRKSNNSYLTFRELMSPPFSILWRMDKFNDLGLQWVENTPDELEAATKEMLERTAVGKNSNYTEDDLQIKFKAIAEACGKNYGKWHARALVTLPRDFLEKHADLLKG